MDAIDKLNQQQRRNIILLKGMKCFIYIFLLILSWFDITTASNNNENYFKILLLFALPFVLDMFVALFDVDTHIAKQIPLVLLLVVGGIYVLISFSGMIIYPDTKSISLYQSFKCLEQDYIYCLAIFPLSVIFT